MTNVSGVLEDAKGDPYSGADVQLIFKRDIVGYNSDAIVGNVLKYQTDGSGNLVMAGLSPGKYTLSVTVPKADGSSEFFVRSQGMVVKDQASQDLGDALTSNVTDIVWQGVQLNSPTFTGTVSGSPTITSPTITSPTITGTVSGGATITSPTITGLISGTAVQQSADDTTEGRVARFDAFRGTMGLGGTRAIVSTDWGNIPEAGLYTNGSTSSDLVGGPGSYSHMSLLNMRSDSPGSAFQIASRNVDTSLELYARTSNNFPIVANWEELYHTGNTTVDGSGFLLQASPIVRVHTNSIVEPNKPVNATLAHSKTGVYVLSGVPPLATEGWTVRTPEDLNGNKVVAIDPPEYDTEAGTLTLRTYDLLWQDGRLVPGDPMDVPRDYFVMLRFHEEPADDEVAE